MYGHYPIRREGVRGSGGRGGVLHFLLSPFLSVIFHLSYLYPQYPLNRLVFVQLCISGIPTLACPWLFSGLFSLSTVSKRSAGDLQRGFSGYHLVCFHVNFNDQTSRAPEVKSPSQSPAHMHACMKTDADGNHLWISLSVGMWKST